MSPSVTTAIQVAHRRRIKTEEKAKAIAAFLAALAIFHQDDFNKRMNRTTATWRNGFLEKMADHSVHTILNHYPTRMDVLPKMFVQIILASKWLVRHSSTRPPFNSDSLCLPFCLYPSSIWGCHTVIPNCSRDSVPPSFCFCFLCVVNQNDGAIFWTNSPTRS